MYFFLSKLQNNIPVFCPALTDGSLGDVMYFHTYTNPGLIVDLVQGELPNYSYRISVYCETNRCVLMEFPFSIPL